MCMLACLINLNMYYMLTFIDIKVWFISIQVFKIKNILFTNSKDFSWKKITQNWFCIWKNSFSHTVSPNVEFCIHLDVEMHTSIYIYTNRVFYWSQMWMCHPAGNTDLYTLYLGKTIMCFIENCLISVRKLTYTKNVLPFCLNLSKMLNS